MAGLSIGLGIVMVLCLLNLGGIVWIASQIAHISVPGAGDDARETVGVDRPEATSTVRPETLRRKAQSDDDWI